ncbi:hypothetical protein DPMN_063613 [Dreissena polymorpha]|uniref:Uncharacterized protein n=1 Tax=Dreissena polymorpha TaxID=45954 RepID=A0A9D4CC10_DREPO|nr:hypothetical protein DPMN_063607 [Dreissena polymorpha]KAH3720709.1 hypothetical protein DPMN_063613 [Dreissena polymorpha]
MVRQTKTAKSRSLEITRYYWDKSYEKFHEDRKINVASRVKNATPPDSQVFQPTGIMFYLIQDIIKTNHLTKCHEDWTINVASRELTRQMLTAHDGQRTTDKKGSQKLTMSTLCSERARGGEETIQSRLYVHMTVSTITQFTRVSVVRRDFRSLLKRARLLRF